MSIKCLNRVWEYSKQKGSALLLLLAISDNAKDNGVAWPGIEYLASKTRVSTRTVMRLIKTIEDSGELIVSRELKYNRYYINVWPPRGPDIRCNRCGIPDAKELGIEMHKHHITPKSEGGSDDDENMEILCADCHRDHHNYASGDILSPIEKGDIPGVLYDIYGSTGDKGGLSSDIAKTPEPLLTVINHKEQYKNIKNIGGAGFYIFNLIGYDFKEADIKDRNEIDTLINQYGEYKLCTMADRFIIDSPGMKLRPLLKKLEKDAPYFDMPVLENEGELEF